MPFRVSDQQPDRLFFSDTTLRDGEQMPGASLEPGQKVEIARALAEAGIDSIDAGFPACARSEIEAVRRIVAEVEGPVVTVLARALEQDVDAAWEALSDADPRRRAVSIFLSCSPVHREHKLRKSKAELLGMIERIVAFARQRFHLVSFSPEDASRTEPDFLCEVYRVAIDSGAGTVGFPDTVGILNPEKVRSYLRTVAERVPNIDRAWLAVHFHNDLGLATANTLAAIEEGAHIVQCTVNGIGERAGNTSLEEVVMALLLHRDHYRRTFGVDATRLTALSRLAAELTGIPVGPNKPVVGANVFATEAGIHQDGILKHPETYLPFAPERVGAPEVRLVLGKHSGRAVFQQRLEALGFALTRSEIDRVVERVKEADKSAWSDADRLLRDTVTALRPDAV